MSKIYALYKGDEYVTDGTLEELAGKTGKKLASLEWMLTPAAKKRASAGSSVLVCIGEEIYVKKCVICGKAFRAKLPPNKKYCSVSCRQKAQKLKDKKMAFPNLPESERERKCASCGKVFVANRSDQRYCSKKCSSNGGGYRGTMLDLPPQKRRYESHIEEINARARAQHKSYGQLQAEKLLARLHAEMNGVRA
jgi:predicted nucleic acid-binding Zn ribbon protein